MSVMDLLDKSAPFVIGVSLVLLIVLDNRLEIGIIDSIWNVEEPPAAGFSYTSITFESREEYLEKGNALITDIDSFDTRLHCASRGFESVDRAVVAVGRNASPKVVVDWLALRL